MQIIRKIIKGLLWVTLVVIALTMFLALFGVGDYLLDICVSNDDVVVMRWSLGLGNPNILHGIYCCMIVLLIVGYCDKLSKWSYLYLTIMNIALYFITISVVGVIIAQIVIIILKCHCKSSVHKQRDDFANNKSEG